MVVAKMSVLGFRVTPHVFVLCHVLHGFVIGSMPLCDMLVCVSLLCLYITALTRAKSILNRLAVAMLN